MMLRLEKGVTTQQNVIYIECQKKFSNCLEHIGFNLISLANNHTWDFGAEGVEDTKEALDKLNINYAGLDYKPFTIFNLNNQKIGFCSFAPNYRTPSILKIEKAKEIVKELSKTCEIVIVFFMEGEKELIIKTLHVKQSTVTVKTEEMFMNFLMP